MKAHLRHARISYKKANLVAGLVRRMPVNQALDTLQHVPKKGARMLYDVIQSAASNAEHNDRQDRSQLYVKEIIVNEGPSFRRFIPIARGRARGIDKATSHISVKLGLVIPKGEEKKVEAKKQKIQKKEKKQEVVTATEGAGPTTHAPGNPAKQGEGAEHSGDDPHAGGSHEKEGGGTFTQHRQGSRGE